MPFIKYKDKEYEMKIGDDYVELPCPECGVRGALPRKIADAIGLKFNDEGWVTIEHQSIKCNCGKEFFIKNNEYKEIAWKWNF